MRLLAQNRVCTGCMWLVVLSTGALLAEELTIDDAIRLAPNLDSANPKWSSIEIGGYIDSAGQLGGEKTSRQVRLIFHAVYRAPDQFAMSVSDFRDGTPLFFAANGKAIVYDPIRCVVIYINDANIQCSIFQELDKLNFGFIMATGPNESSKVRFDAHSLVSAPSKSSNLSKDETGAFGLTLTSSRGNKLHAVIRPTWFCPLAKIELFEGDALAPVFAVNRIFFDGDVEDCEFAFPSKDALRKAVNLYEMPNNLPAGELVGLIQAAHAILARMAVHDHDLRGKIKEVDWDRVEQSDAKFSKALRTMLTPENRTP
jgi:hypothetical protein